MLVTLSFYHFVPVILLETDLHPMVITVPITVPSQLRVFFHGFPPSSSQIIPGWARAFASVPPKRPWRQPLRSRPWCLMDIGCWSPWFWMFWAVLRCWGLLNMVVFTTSNGWLNGTPGWRMDDLGGTTWYHHFWKRPDVEPWSLGVL